jgi:hypothetical protein
MIEDDKSSNESRTKRTGHQARREQTEKELMLQWRAKAAPGIQLQLDDSQNGFQSIESKPQCDVVDIFLGAGKPLGFVLDESRQCFELDADLAHVYSPRTSLLARAARDLVAQSIQRPAERVSLKVLLLLDEQSGKATPSWRIRFERAGVDASAIEPLERRLRSLIDLVASESDAISLKPAEQVVPKEEMAEQIVAAALAIRIAAGGKPIAADCSITSSEFQSPIKVPEKVGAKPEVEGEVKPDDDLGEVVGYNRCERLIFVLFEGRRVSTELSADMEVFSRHAIELANIPFNKCHIWYQLDEKSNKGRGLKLASLKVLSEGGLFAQLPEFVVPDSAAAGSIDQVAEQASVAAVENECTTAHRTRSS